MEDLERMQEPIADDWVELANGGGVMLRDAKRPGSRQPEPYKRWRKQLLDPADVKS